MKFIAISALLGATQAITLWTTNGQVAYEESDSDSDDEAAVQLGDDYFHAGESGQLGSKEYERVTPARFAADSDDIFMRSMIEQYAQEHKNKDGSPNGVFSMNEGSARAAATEVLATNARMNPADIGAYLNTYWAKAWGHFDVNRTGSIEVIKMPQLMRFLASDQQMYLW